MEARIASNMVRLRFKPLCICHKTQWDISRTAKHTSCHCICLCVDTYVSCFACGCVCVPVCAWICICLCVCENVLNVFIAAFGCNVTISHKRWSFEVFIETERVNCVSFTVCTNCSTEQYLRLFVCVNSKAKPLKIPLIHSYIFIYVQAAFSIP